MKENHVKLIFNKAVFKERFEQNLHEKDDRAEEKKIQPSPIDKANKNPVDETVKQLRKSMRSQSVKRISMLLLPRKLVLRKLRKE